MADNNKLTLDGYWDFQFKTFGRMQTPLLKGSGAVLLSQVLGRRSSMICAPPVVQLHIAADLQSPSFL